MLIEFMELFLRMKIFNIKIPPLKKGVGGFEDGLIIKNKQTIVNSKIDIIFSIQKNKAPIT